MPVAAADLKAWLPVNVPEDDTSTAGGAIQDDNHASGGAKVEFTALGADDDVEVLSDGADVRTVTVTGRDAAGTIQSDVITLNGATPAQAGAPTTFERILKIALSAKDASRTVTVRRAPGGATIATLGPDCLSVHRFFYDSASSASQEDRYELCYLQNDHATLGLDNAMVKLTADPVARITFGLAAAKGDVGTITNRKTAPAGVTFTDADKTVPGSNILAQERIAVWVRQRLPASDPAFASTFDLELTGNST